MPRNPEEIKKDILDELAWDTRVEAMGVRVNVSDRLVTLSGEVPTYVSRMMAEQDAKSIAGGLEVDNRLVVRLPNDKYAPSDKDIEEAVKNVLMWNPVIESAKLEIRVNKGVVNIEGTVDAFWKKMRAENLVSGIKGVLDIVNRITVVPTKNFLDESIAKGIERAISRTFAVDMKRINVKVEKGQVILTGMVNSRLASYIVESAARHSSGVKGVKNELVIENV